MDLTSQWAWINGLWVLFCLYWIVSALKLKKTKKRESWEQRFRYVLPLVAAFFLFKPRAHYGWLGARFVPVSDAVAWIGVVLAAAGVAIAIWARWHLGANWSGVVTLKE
jgi:protein-S-isoprenylcysteine O-methyltransferase Ste14